MRFYFVQRSSQARIRFKTRLVIPPRIETRSHLVDRARVVGFGRSPDAEVQSEVHYPVIYRRLKFSCLQPRLTTRLAIVTSAYLTTAQIQ
jgi:hypothetical protein